MRRRASSAAARGTTRRSGGARSSTLKTERGSSALRVPSANLARAEPGQSRGGLARLLAPLCPVATRAVAYRSVLPWLGAVIGWICGTAAVRVRGDSLYAQPVVVGVLGGVW